MEYILRVQEQPLSFNCADVCPEAPAISKYSFSNWESSKLLYSSIIGALLAQIHLKSDKIIEFKAVIKK